MQTREWTFTDKAQWGEGPWVGEPDKVQWQDGLTGLPCLIVRNCHVTGALCGYVGVPPGHPLHGRSYNDASDLLGIVVHGGLTFADRCSPEEGNEGICHIADPGEPDDVWWFGFDCAHAFDVSPRMAAILGDIYKDKPRIPGIPERAYTRFNERYWDVAAVKSEVTSLAVQLAGAQ